MRYAREEETKAAIEKGKQSRLALSFGSLGADFCGRGCIGVLLVKNQGCVNILFCKKYGCVTIVFSQNTL